jgi:hypothetical protein
MCFAANDLRARGMYYAQAVGTKDSWPTCPDGMVALSDSSAINRFVSKGHGELFAYLNEHVLDLRAVDQGLAFMTLDVAVTAAPVRDDLSFVLDGKLAGSLIKFLTSDDGDPRLLYDGTDEYSSSEEDDPSIPMDLPDEEEEYNVSIVTRQEDDATIILTQDLLHIEESERNITNPDDEISDGNVSVAGVLDLIGNSGNHLHWKLGTHGLVGNVQHGKCTLLPLVDEVDRQAVKVVPPDLTSCLTVAGSGQFYMPDLRSMFYKKQRSLELRSLLSYPQNVKNLMTACVIGDGSTDDTRSLFTKVHEQTIILSKLYRDASTSIRLRPRMPVRLECRFWVNHQNASGFRFPMLKHDPFAGSILAVLHDSLCTYFHGHMEEHVIPLETSFQSVQPGGAIDFASFGAPALTALCIHAEFAVHFFEVVPNYLGAVARSLLRRTPDFRGVLHIPPDSRTRVSSQVSLCTKLQYGADPYLLPITQVEIVDGQLSVHDLNITHARQSSKQFRSPALYAVFSAEIHRLFQVFSANVDGDAVSGLLVAPDFQALASRNARHRRIFLIRLVTVLIDMYQLLYAEMISSQQRRIATRAQRSTAVVIPLTGQTLPKNLHEVSRVRVTDYPFLTLAEPRHAIRDLGKHRTVVLLGRTKFVLALLP